MTEEQELEVNERYKNGENTVYLAKEYKVSTSTISNILNRQNVKDRTIVFEGNNVSVGKVTPWVEQRKHRDIILKLFKLQGINCFLNDEEKKAIWGLEKNALWVKHVGDGYYSLTDYGKLCAPMFLWGTKIRHTLIDELKISFKKSRETVTKKEDGTMEIKLEHVIEISPEQINYIDF